MHNIHVYIINWPGLYIIIVLCNAFVDLLACELI